MAQVRQSLGSLLRQVGLDAGRPARHSGRAVGLAVDCRPGVPGLDGHRPGGPASPNDGGNAGAGLMKVTRRGFLLSAIGVGVAATPAAWYGAVYEPKDIEVVHRRVVIPRLPSNLQGMTAVQISDFHLKGG